MVRQTVRRFCDDESGQDLAKYALLLVLLVIVTLVAIRLLGETVSGFFNNLGNTLKTAA